MTHSHMPTPSRSCKRLALVVYVLTSLGFFAASSAPTPLYGLYQQVWGFSSASLALVFGIYALALLAALLVTGSLSDHIGRRPVILGSLALEIVAMILFVDASGLRMLLAARLLQGLASGAAASVIPAAVLDVGHSRAPLLNSLAPVLGMGCGAIGTSVLMEYAPFPMRLVFVLLIGTFLLQALICAMLPETVSRKAGALTSLIPSIRIPRSAHRAMTRVAPANLAAWALGGFYLSLGPALARLVTGSHSVILGGGVVLTLCLGATAAILLFRTLPPAVTLLMGAVTLAAGLVITLGGVHARLAGILFAGTFCAGMGLGLVFQSALRSVLPQAEAHERAGLMAAYFVMSYLAFSIPAMIAGAMTRRVGLETVTDTYGGSLIVLASLTAVVCWRGMRHRASPASMCPK